MTQALQSGRHQAASALLAHEGPAIYGERDQLLAPMDRAMVAFAAADWPASIAACEQGKRLAEALYTKHVFAHAEAYALGDDWLPYVGEPFERLALHLIEAMAYLARNEVDEARVEVRAMQARLRDRVPPRPPGTDDAAVQAVQQAESSRASGRGDNAFAYFLAGLLQLHDAANLASVDDALIDLEQALTLYGDQGPGGPALPVPSALLQVLCPLVQKRPRAQANAQALQRCQTAQGTAQATAHVPWTGARGPALTQRSGGQLGQVVVLHLAGEIPAKYEEAWEVFTGLQIVRIPYPVYGAAQVAPGHLYAKLAAAPTWQAAEAVADLGEMARNTLQRHIAAIKKRAVARAVAASVAADALVVGGGIKGGAVGGVLQLVGLGIGIGHAATSHADLRSWRTLPDKIELAALVAPPGPVDLDLQVVGLDASPTLQRRLRVKVAAGATTYVVLRSL